jgi:3-oxoacyl-[acyl-carrier protein] reductase
MRLKDRVAIVTGSGSGIGRTIAVAFAGEGASVVIIDYVEPLIDEVIAEITEKRGTALGVYCDVTKLDQVKAMVQKTIDKFGRIDILVNNAGGGGGDTSDKFLEGNTQDIADAVVDGNLKGCINCTMEVFRHMIKQKYGKIVNVSSQAGRYGSELAGPYYAAAKGGLLAFTRQMALKLGPYGIYVNAFAPGVTLSGPRIEGKWNVLSEEERQRRLMLIPLRRLGTKEEQANVALFLASDESSYITGATIDSNGGRFMS